MLQQQELLFCRNKL